MKKPLCWTPDSPSKLVGRAKSRLLYGVSALDLLRKSGGAAEVSVVEGSGQVHAQSEAPQGRETLSGPTSVVRLFRHPDTGPGGRVRPKDDRSPHGSGNVNSARHSHPAGGRRRTPPPRCRDVPEKGCPGQPRTHPRPSRASASPHQPRRTPRRGSRWRSSSVGNGANLMFRCRRVSGLTWMPHSWSRS